MNNGSMANLMVHGSWLHGCKTPLKIVTDFDIDVRSHRLQSV